MISTRVSAVSTLPVVRSMGAACVGEQLLLLVLPNFMGYWWHGRHGIMVLPQYPCHCHMPKFTPPSPLPPLPGMSQLHTGGADLTQKAIDSTDGQFIMRLGDVPPEGLLDDSPDGPLSQLIGSACSPEWKIWSRHPGPTALQVSQLSAAHTSARASHVDGHSMAASHTATLRCLWFVLLRGRPGHGCSRDPAA